MTFAESYGPLWGQVIAFNLKQLGLDVKIAGPATRGADRQDPDPRRGLRPRDQRLGRDYADPYDFMNVILDGTKLQAGNNVNISYFDDPEYNRKMAQAAALSGPERYSDLRQARRRDHEERRPDRADHERNRRYFVSSRLGCFTYQPVLGAPNLAALCLK